MFKFIFIFLIALAFAFMAFLDHKDILSVTGNYFSSGSMFQFDGLFFWMFLWSQGSRFYQKSFYGLFGPQGRFRGHEDDELPLVRAFFIFIYSDFLLLWPSFGPF